MVVRAHATQATTFLANRLLRGVQTLLELPTDFKVERQAFADDELNGVSESKESKGYVNRNAFADPGVYDSKRS